MGNLIQFLVDNWGVVEANPGLFLVFGVFCAGFTCVAVAFFYDRVLNRDIPERRDLMEQVERLTAENQVLQEENRRLRTNEIFLQGRSAAAGQPSMGDKIADAVSR